MPPEANIFVSSPPCSEKWEARGKSSPKSLLSYVSATVTSFPSVCEEEGFGFFPSYSRLMPWFHPFLLSVYFFSSCFQVLKLSLSSGCLLSAFNLDELVYLLIWKQHQRQGRNPITITKAPSSGSPATEGWTSWLNYFHHLVPCQPPKCSWNALAQSPATSNFSISTVPWRLQLTWAHRGISNSWAPRLGHPRFPSPSVLLNHNSEGGEEKQVMPLKAISEPKLIRSSALWLGVTDWSFLLGWLLIQDREDRGMRGENLKELLIKVVNTIYYWGKIK